MCLLSCSQSHIARGGAPSGKDLAQSSLHRRQQPSRLVRIAEGVFEWHGHKWTHACGDEQGFLHSQSAIPPLKQGPLGSSSRSVYVLAYRHQSPSRIRQNRKRIPPSDQITSAWWGSLRFSGSPHLLLDQDQRLSKMVVAEAAESSPSELQQTCPSLLRKVDAFDKSFSAWLYGDGRMHLRSFLKFLELSGKSIF
jgi:hypothetical protein